MWIKSYHLVYAQPLQWNRGVSPVAHYLDDFITLEPPGSPQCQNNLEGIIQACRDTGKPSSGTGGCRVYESGWWIQHKWPQVMEDHHISTREMIPIVMSEALWGKGWQRQSVRFWSDNSAVVALINSGSSRENTLMHLMRCLVFIMAHYNFVASAAHIKGSDNNVADALSKDNKGYFLSHYPQAQSNPTTVSPQELLVTKQPDWTSPHWSQLWSDIFTQH